MMEITGYKKKHVWGNSTVYLMDCMEALPQYPAGYFDLAVVDPPYGNIDAIGLTDNKRKKTQATKRSKYKLFENISPDNLFYLELENKSKNQIVWGGNFLGLCGGAIVWQKMALPLGRLRLQFVALTKV